MTPAKRAFDTLAAAVGLVVLSPLFLVIALAVSLGDGGPVFFRQARVGRGGRQFRMWKFRTMVPDAERRGRQITVGDDPRITPVGRLLRKAKLDELPQLFNVLTGEMSLVGPRPEVPRYTALYAPDERPVLELVPGITDPASIRYRDEGALLATASDPERAYTERIMREKIRLNLEYASRATRWTDLMIVLRTVARVAVPGSPR
jgi:lipopolysaccharide/colanic/teichoic acid biosynthesis glycosyltransferase